VSGSYKEYKYPKVIIGHAVKYYYRYKLSLRDISELMLDRGVEVTYETLRQWNKTWGPVFAKGIRCKRRSPFTDKWHIDEGLIKINDIGYWLWRLVDSEGEDIAILVQKQRNAKAAVKFLKKALHTAGFPPQVMITDKLKSYKAAKKTILKSTEHRSHKRLNNRCEDSHPPTREKEKQMRKFKSPASTQRFLSSMGQINNLPKVGRYKHSAQQYKSKLKNALTILDQIAHSHHQSASISEEGMNFPCGTPKQLDSTLER
jgi:putative transposase